MKSDQIELEIIKFIERNPGKTINRIAEVMSEKGISSRMTTLKKINDLKSAERGLIEDRQAIVFIGFISTSKVNTN